MAPTGTREPVSLPQISFRKVEDGDTTQPTGVHDGSARNYGFNNFKTFERPDHYIRYIEPLETDLATQVEYDMDEQDQEWLDQMNKDRKKEQLDSVSYEMFEVIMDRLEKEWFDLMKLIPKPDMALPVEDTTCAICDDGEAENSNAILFCDGCNLAVHQDCYGVPYIPEGQWLCRKCVVSPDHPVSCILCPNEGGAFKQTNRGQWTHLLCAIWVPEVTVANTFIMEPIECVENIPKSRWKLVCALCREREGACIQCDVKTCFTAFHVTCARRNKLLMAMKNLPGQEETPLRAFCERHLPKQLKDLRDAASAAASEEEEESPVTSPARRTTRRDNVTAMKAARAYSQKFSAIGGPPLVPNIIVEHITTYIHKIRIVKKPAFIAAVARYWSLKRESRRGAPLLKRLHLEPWTASTSSRQQSDEEKTKKLENLIRLRKDLEKIRMLTELVRKREKEKLRAAQTVQTLVRELFFPHTRLLQDTLRDVTAQDRGYVFRDPVSPNDAPDYYEVVKCPMTWTRVQEKIDAYEYFAVGQFIDDVELVINNGLLYNPKASLVYRTADRLKGSVEPILSKLRETVRSFSSEATVQPVLHEDAPVQKQEPIDHAPDDAFADSSPGDLEAALEALEVLFFPSSIANYINFFLPDGEDPLKSLLTLEAPKTRDMSNPPQVETPTTDNNRLASEVVESELGGPQTADSEVMDLASAVKARSRKGKSAKGHRKARLGEATDEPSAENIDDSTRLDVPSFTSPTSTQKFHKKPSNQDTDDVPMDETTSNPTVKSTPKPRKRQRPVKEIAQSNLGVAEVPEIGLPSDTEGPPAKRRKRESDTSQAVESAVAPVVENVDPKDSFLLFNQGWVLPSGSRRGGRERLELPPLSKKPRKTSKLSGSATSPDFNETLLPGTAPSYVSRASQGAESILSDLTSLPDQTDAPVAPAPRPRLNIDVPIDKPVKVAEEMEQEMLEVDNSLNEGDPVSAEPMSPDTAALYPPGTLVWAKLVSFPYFPAVVWDEQDDEDDPVIPAGVFGKKDEIAKSLKNDEPLTLVRFYDATKSWGWMPPNKIKLLGEDPDVDKFMLTEQKFKSSNIKAQCRKAFTDALAEMERPEDVVHPTGVS